MEMTESQHRIFDPKGAQSERKVVYDLISAPSVGAIITFQMLNEVLGRDFKSDRGPLYKARQDLERINKRCLESVPGVGYRVVDGIDQVKLAGRRFVYAGRQINKGLVTVCNVDRNKLSDDEIKIADRTERRLRARLDSTSRKADKAERQHLPAVTPPDRTVGRNTARLSQKERLAQLERQMAEFAALTPPSLST